VKMIEIFINLKKCKVS